MPLFSKLFGDENDRFLKRAFRLVGEINALESEFKKLSDEELKNKTQEFKTLVASGYTLDTILPQAFAAVREASVRTLGQRHFDVQLVGGLALHEGKIAEMKTGEGKTLTATLAIYLNALEGKGAHVVTVNDYLARRDTVWMGQIYHFLGLIVGCINHETSYLYNPSVVGNIKDQENGITNYQLPITKQIPPLRQGSAGQANPNDQNSEVVSKLPASAKASAGRQAPSSKLDDVRDVVGGFKVIHEFLRPCSRAEAYRADITYGTNNEFGFDYLRDNLVYDIGQLAQRSGSEGSPSTSFDSAQDKSLGASWNYAIVDEVDSILIDEARTPLIISQPDEESGQLYQKFARLVPRLKAEEHYKVDEKMRSAVLTQEGISRVENFLGVKNLYEEGGVRLVHHLEQALKAQVLFKRDKDYIVKDGEVVIVDEFTGRLMPGRRYSEGLHQAIEAKEGVAVKRESRTVATITFQNYFRLYKKLAGMSGTALTSAEEFRKVYNLDVAVIPTHKPMIRLDQPDMIYRSEPGKFQAVLRRVKELNEKGQPVLLGSSSIEKNEHLSALLHQVGVDHKVLNAKNHEAEAQIIAQAGRRGAVTLATNIAGRGVDIVLGGNPPDAAEAQKVKDAGGLFVLGTGRHEARRIDNQLRGRSGRQGDAGESQFFVSLEDDLMRVFGGDKIKSIMARFNIPEDEAIQSSLVSRAIEAAQAKIEGYHFDMRKHVLEYDEVMNKHRDVVYKMRRQFVGSENAGKIKETILDTLRGEAKNLVLSHASAAEDVFDIEGIVTVLARIVPISESAGNDLKSAAEKIKADQEKLINLLVSFIEAAYQSREAELGAEAMAHIGKLVLLRTLDELWMDHLEEMEHLRDSVGLRAYGQRDPLVEYKTEGHRLFQDFLAALDSQVAGLIFKVGTIPAGIRGPTRNDTRTNAENISENRRPVSVNQRSVSVSQRSGDKVGRNDPCPCGSGKKYKKCHGT
ncbi:MAG: preprotein translocase subunit SecA [Parcubacteria group bacterium]|nr:preprotein translocase subunit SecA [Parcubacteria group bacterium]